MRVKYKLVRIEYANNNFFVLGKYSFWKNLLSFWKLKLDDCAIIDFHWNKHTGLAEQIYFNSLKIIESEPQMVINKNKIIFETKPNENLLFCYNDIKDQVNKTQEL